MALATLAAASRRRGTGPAAVLFFGALIVVMLLAAPVCHTHYLSLLVPLVMGLIVAAWGRRNDMRLGLGLTALLVFNAVIYILAALPGRLKLAPSMSVHRCGSKLESFAAGASCANRRNSSLRSRRVWVLSSWRMAPRQDQATSRESTLSRRLVIVSSHPWQLHVQLNRASRDGLKPHVRPSATASAIYAF